MKVGDGATAKRFSSTETLLWLSREDGSQLPKQETRLDSLLLQCNEELQYLLQNKAVTVHLDTEEATLLLPVIPSKILLDNLIRNAFQHTHEGEVTIYQRGNRVRISNRETASDTMLNQELGFGLGLDLSRKLAERFQWSYRNERSKNGHDAEIEFH